MVLRVSTSIARRSSLVRTHLAERVHGHFHVGEVDGFLVGRDADLDGIICGRGGEEGGGVRWRKDSRRACSRRLTW